MNRNHVVLLLKILFSVASGHLVWSYLRFPIHGAMSFVMGVGIFLLVNRPVRIRSKALLFFSGLFAVSLVLASHVVVTGGVRDLSDKNYISNYTWVDILALVVIFVVVSQGVVRLLNWYRGVAETKLLARSDGSVWTSLMEKPLWVYVLIICLCWLPWPLSWYPGFIYGDSISSVMQAQGLWGYNNHHPIVYTLWLKIWLTLGIKIHNVSLGCAIYTLTQMILIAWALSWMARWMYRKNVNPAYCVFTLAYFALTPFFAQNNASMWKDPLFSSAVLILCIRLYDYFTEKTILKARTVFWIGLFSAFVCALRNNGAYVILFTALAAAGLCLFYRTSFFRKKALWLAGAMFVLASVTIVIQGPVFHRLHWNQSYAETVGLPLNQMARVVAYNGRMSARNKAFMAKLYPLDKYKEVYAPGLVDRFKWARGFDAGYLGSHKNEFFKNYISMMAKNPRIAFEGWELLTIGYWSVDHFTFDTGNLPKGCLWCFKWWTKDHGIKTKNFLANPAFDSRAVFSQYDATVPLGLVTWLVVLLAILSFARRNAETQVALLPLLAVILSLLLAVPIHYWERYGYMLTLATPLLLVMLARASQSMKVSETSEATYGEAE